MPRMKGKVGREESCIWLMTGRSAPWGGGAPPQPAATPGLGTRVGRAMGMEPGMMCGTSGLLCTVPSTSSMLWIQ